MGAPFPPMRRSPLLHKAALVPLWMLQLVVMFGIIGIQVYLGTTKGFGRPETLIFMSLSAFCAILTVVEIALFAAHKLRPLPYLILQLVKLIIWLTLLGLWLASISTWGEITMTMYFIIQLLQTVLPVLAFLTPSLYASIIYHRHRLAPRHRHRLFSLEEGKYPEVSEKTPSSHPWPATSEIHMSKYPYASSTLVGECDAAPSPLSPRQELGDEGWVKELEGGRELRGAGGEVHELGREEREVYELAAVRTPRVGSQRGSCGEEVVGRKGVRGRLSEALSPKTRSRNGSRGGLGEARSPKTRSRRVSGEAGKTGGRKGSRKGGRDELGAVARPKTRVQRVDKRTMW